MVQQCITYPILTPDHNITFHICFLIPVIQSLVKILNAKMIQISQSIYFCNINFSEGNLLTWNWILINQWGTSKNIHFKNLQCSLFHSVCCQHLLHSSFNAWHQRTFIISLMSGCHCSLHARLSSTLISERIWVSGICSETVYEPGCFAHVVLLTHASSQIPLEGYNDDVWATAHLECIQSVFHISAHVCGGLLVLGEGDDDWLCFSIAPTCSWTDTYGG